MIPIVDGHEALTAIRQFEGKPGVTPAAGVKVIMVTSLDGPTEVYQSISSGALDYITKPVERGELTAILTWLNAEAGSIESQMMLGAHFSQASQRLFSSSRTRS